tara:strand:+ start:378 stop:1262 length:885 start_codon:yes stop_codon:yes gene_type:complete
MDYLPNSLLAKELQKCSLLLNKRINKILPINNYNSKIIDAMRYCVLSSGKRIRPFLVINSAKLFDVSVSESINTAIAIEFIHTYSLIHDDLPAMDNDDMRRGALTCHKKFDEATAILTGDAFLTYAFEILSNPDTHNDPEIRCKLIEIIAKSAGFNGMVGGQMMDLENGNNNISSHEMAKLHRLKTGELFMSCVEAGAILGGANVRQKKALRYYAHDLGLAFQIKDDILDHCDNDNNIKCRNKNETSIVELIGIEGARKQLNLLKSQAIARLSIFGKKANILIDLAEFVIARDK